MTDLRTLLHDAAPTPLRPLDMAAVRRRSQRLGLRRVGVWVGALGVDPPPTSVAAAADGASTASGAGSGRFGDDPSPLTQRPSGEGAATTTPEMTQAGGYPEAAQCSVDNRGLGAGEQRRCRFTATKAGGAGMTSSGPVDPGSTDVRGEVILTRAGQTTRYEVVRNEARAGDLRVFVGCDFSIEPGDLVEIVLTNGSDPQATTTTLGAGDGWAC